MLCACVFVGKHKANKGWGALHLASYFGHTEVVKFLIEVLQAACLKPVLHIVYVTDWFTEWTQRLSGWLKVIISGDCMFCTIYCRRYLKLLSITICAGAHITSNYQNAARVSQTVDSFNECSSRIIIIIIIIRFVKRQNVKRLPWRY